MDDHSILTANHLKEEVEVEFREVDPEEQRMEILAYKRLVLMEDDKENHALVGVCAISGKKIIYF